MDINKFATDTNAAENGVWFYLDSDEETGFLIARLGNKKYRKAAARLLGPHQQALARGSLKLDTQDRLLAQICSDTIVLDWKGITKGVDAKGEPKNFPYSKEACESLLVEEKYADLVKTILEFAGEAENYREEEIRNSENESNPE